MECNNCQSLFSMIKALNKNISSLLTGYGLLLNVVNDHEDQICQLREKHIENSHECSDKHEDCAKIDIVADCEIPIADNIDILSTISNVDISDSEAEAYEKAQSVLNAVYDYMYANQLHINVEKSCYMHFRHEYSNKERLVCARTDRTYDRLLSLKLCDKKLKKVSKVKFLGVIIDEKLKWEAHIEHLQKKLKLSIIMIKRVKKFIPKK